MSEESSDMVHLSAAGADLGAPASSVTSPEDAGGDRRARGSPHERATQALLVVGARGLHVRAAAQVALVASRYPCAVTLRHGDATANAKSVMEMLLLRATCGVTLEAVAVGDRARECLSELEVLASERFGDPPRGTLR